MTHTITFEDMPLEKLYRKRLTANGYETIEAIVVGIRHGGVAAALQALGAGVSEGQKRYTILVDWLADNDLIERTYRNRMVGMSK